MEEKIEVMNVSGRFCVFSHKDRQHQRFFQLLPDGSIRDIDSPGHDNERFWDFQNNQICLYSNQRQLTATFDCCYEEEGHSYWEGWHNTLFLWNFVSMI